MFSIPETFFLYTLLAIVCPMLCVLSDRTNSKWGVYMAYALLILVSMIRFDIGADYENHATMFMNRAQTLNHGVLRLVDYLKPEPLIYLFIFLFKDLDYCYVYVFGVISLISVVLMYKVLDYYKIHTLGILMYIVSFTLFQTWDWARQGMALSFFLFSLRYVEARNPWKYLLCIFLAIISHYSAFLLVPMYWIYRYAPKHRLTSIVICSVLFGMFCLVEVGIFSSLHERLVALIPFYGQIYSKTGYMQNGEGTYHTSTYIVTVLMYIAIIFFTKKEHAGLAVLMGLGAFIYIIAGGNLNFTRVAWYVTSIQIILVPKILLDSEGELYNKMFVRYLYLFLVLFAIFEYVYIKSNFRDVVPYETVFSEEFSRQQFRIRAY